MKPELLHVVTCFFNPIRWQSRLRMYKEFEQHMLDSGVRLTTVECQLGERPFELAGNPHINHVPIRAKTILWNKECLLRIGMSRFQDPDWKYTAWLDSDIFFRRSDWASETVHALQQYDIIQPWTDAYDLGPNDSHLAAYKSFLHQWWNGHSVVHGVPGDSSHFEKRIKGLNKHHLISQTDLATTHDGKHVHAPPYYGYVASHQTKKMPWWRRDGGSNDYPHTGYAWAARRDMIDHVGGLFDLAAMGAGDYHMALALVGHAAKSVPGNVHAAYKKHLLAWEERALQHVNFNMGYLQGTIEHRFHGAKGDRRYIDRWEIILEHDFDPDTDIVRNTHGVFELRCTKPRLRHDLNVYFHQRNEDANII